MSEVGGSYQIGAPSGPVISPGTWTSLRSAVLRWRDDVAQGRIGAGADLFDTFNGHEAGFLLPHVDGQVRLKLQFQPSQGEHAEFPWELAVGSGTTPAVHTNRCVVVRHPGKLRARRADRFVGRRALLVVLDQRQSVKQSSTLPDVVEIINSMRKLLGAVAEVEVRVPEHLARDLPGCKTYEGLDGDAKKRIPGLRDLLREGHDIVHLLGHSVDSASDARSSERAVDVIRSAIGVRLRCSDGQELPLLVGDIADALGAGGVRLVVICQACFAGAQFVEPLLSVADHVVGSTARVSSEACKVWAGKFYEHLAQRRSMFEAVGAANLADLSASRGAITLWCAVNEDRPLPARWEEVVHAYRKQWRENLTPVHAALLPGVTAEPIDLELGLDPALGAPIRVPDLLRREERRWLVLGAPGAGKTVSLRYLPARATGDRELAVYVALATWARDPVSGDAAATSFFRYLDGRHHVEGDGLETLAARAQGDLLTLLLDGFDELDDTSRERAWRLLKSLEQWPRLRVIVGSRLAGLDTGWFRQAGFTVADIQPLSVLERRELIGSVLEAFKIQAEQQVVNRVEGAICREGLDKLVGTPLFLALAAAMFADDSTSTHRAADVGEPQCRSAFLLRAVEWLLKAPHRPPPPKPIPPAAQTILEFLASDMIAAGEVDAGRSRKDVGEFLTQRGLVAPTNPDERWQLRLVLQAARGGALHNAMSGCTVDDLLDALNYTGLFGARGADRSRIWFLHRAFQEVLASRVLLRLDSFRSEFLARYRQCVAAVPDTRRFWEMPLAFATDAMPDQAGWLRDLGVSDSETAQRIAVESDGVADDLRKMFLPSALNDRRIARLWTEKRYKEIVAVCSRQFESNVDFTSLAGIDEVLLAIERFELGRRAGSVDPGISADDGELRSRVEQFRAHLLEKLPLPTLAQVQSLRTVPGRAEPFWRLIDIGAGHFFFAAATPLIREQVAALLPIGDGRHWPVEVSWPQANLICRWLTRYCCGTNDAMALDPQFPTWIVRLPTREEWLLAARGGTTGRYCFDPSKQLADYAVYTEATAESRQPLTVVATKLPNARGLYDVHGLVREWCQIEDYDSATAPALGGSHLSDRHRCAFDTVADLQRSTFKAVGVRPILGAAASASGAVAAELSGQRADAAPRAIRSARHT